MSTQEQRTETAQVPVHNYRRLDADRIRATASRLRQRIYERFPESGLHEVASQLELTARQAQQNIETMAKPNLWIRCTVGVLIVTLVLAIGAAVAAAEMPDGFDLGSLVGLFESAINDLVFIGIAIWFLLNLEGRYKQRQALRHLDELRSLAHVVDMHQLTKDPDHLLMEVDATSSSPERHFTRKELARYLDYCSEMLSLTGKVAALYVQDFGNPVVLSSVNEIETLSTSLSRKIWQKLVILVDAD